VRLCKGLAELEISVAVTCRDEGFALDDALVEVAALDLDDLLPGPSVRRPEGCRIPQKLAVLAEQFNRGALYRITSANL